MGPRDLWEKPGKPPLRSAFPALSPCVISPRFGSGGILVHSARRSLNPNRIGKGKESGQTVQVIVRDNNVDQALRALKKKMQREGVFREMKLRRHFEKPSEKKAREKAEAIRRFRKLQRKRAEREG